MKLAVMAAAALLLAAPALADEWDFVLVNNSGKPIKKVELAPATTTTWQENKVDADLKKEDSIKPGGRMTVHFDKGPGCKYDIKATFVDDTASTWSAVNVCDNAYITIRYNAAGATTFTAN
jgi:hypothetical protein